MANVHSVSIFNNGQPYKTELRHWSGGGREWYSLHIETPDHSYIDIHGDTLDELRPLFCLPATRECQA